MLLGRVIEHAHRRYTGARAPLREILKECVFKRAGMTNTELGMQVMTERAQRFYIRATHDCVSERDVLWDAGSRCGMLLGIIAAARCCVQNAH